jgi:hypothetical protein
MFSSQAQQLSDLTGLRAALISEGVDLQTQQPSLLHQQQLSPMQTSRTQQQQQHPPKWLQQQQELAGTHRVHKYSHGNNGRQPAGAVEAVDLNKLAVQLQQSSAAISSMRLPHQQRQPAEQFSKPFSMKAGAMCWTATPS